MTVENNDDSPYGEGPPYPILSPEAYAALDHIERIAWKRMHLERLASEAVGQLASVLQREASTVDLSQIPVLIKWLRQWDIPGSGATVAGAFGCSVDEVATWLRTPPSSPGDIFEGSFPVEDPTPRPGVPCVYALLRHSEIAYIGYSSEVRKRLKRHWGDPAKSGHIDAWRVIVCDSKREALRMEGDLIFRHQPPLNVADKQEPRRVR